MDKDKVVKLVVDNKPKEPPTTEELIAKLCEATETICKSALAMSESTAEAMENMNAFQKAVMAKMEELSIEVTTRHIFEGYEDDDIGFNDIDKVFPSIYMDDIYD